jgi:hypothetical protein
VKHRNLDVESTLFVAQRFEIFVTLEAWFANAWKKAWSVVGWLGLTGNAPVTDFAWERYGRVAD